MFVDDSARHPMTFVVEFEFSGEINRDKFQHAIDESLRRHPMLRSFVQPAKSNRDCWVSTAQYDSQVSWLGFSDPWVVEGTGEYINLREEIGFRCFVRSNTSRAIVTFIFHHSCCDGIGAYQFIGDVLWFYADAHGAVQPELPELNEMDLKQRLRANVNFELVQDAQSSPKIQHAIVNPVAQVQSLDRNEDETAQSTAAAQDSFPAFATKTYGKKEFRELRLRAQKDGQTTNSRLLQSLLLAISSWNQKYSQSAHPNDLIAINMPMDLRRPENPIFSAVNLVTSAFVVRSAAEISKTGELERTLNEEILRLKHNRFQSEFMKMLLQWPLDLNEAKGEYDPDQCHSSAVFSNTGDPTKRFLVEMPRHQGKIHCGNLVLEDINGTPPLRQQTRVSISIFTYQRQLRICMRTDPEFFDLRSASKFLEHFSDQFEKGW